MSKDNLLETSPHFSVGCKLVPWLNWKEWEAVRDSLFSNSQDMIAFAIKRVSTWRSRGCLPVLIDVTASIIEIQQKDPFYRIDMSHSVIESEQIMAMLYCMVILRFVNCVVEKTRKKTELSIAEAASAIGIPRTLIDVRHDGSHRDLPALPVVRDSAVKALNWLKVHYWEAQARKIPFHGDSANNLQKEIYDKLLDLASITKLQQIGSQRIKEKCGKHHKQLCGNRTFFLLYSGQLHSSNSKSGCFKKRRSGIAKTLVRLYSSFSSQVLSALMKLLFRTLGASQGPSSSLLDDWKLVVAQLSEKEPELIPTLLKEILDAVEQRESDPDPSCPHHPSELQHEPSQAEQLCSVFAWMVGRLEGASKGKEDASSPLLVEILRRCLLLSSPCRPVLADSALQLVAQTSHHPSLAEKITRLRSVMSAPASTGQGSPASPSARPPLTIVEQEESLCQASKKFEFLKSCRTKRAEGAAAAGDDDGGGRGSGPRWRRSTRFWRPCPIGMLPSNLGSSGRLPVLDLRLPPGGGPSPLPVEKFQQAMDGGVGSAGTRVNGKRSESRGVRPLDNSGAKKPRGTDESREFDFRAISVPRSIDGCLLVDGVWKRTRREELHDILSRVKILA